MRKPKKGSCVGGDFWSKANGLKIGELIRRDFSHDIAGQVSHGGCTMNKEECISFARKNPVCFLATTEADQPRVRTVLLWSADDAGFYFILLSPKNVSRQLKANPRAEVCFYNHPKTLGEAVQMRVAGSMELVDDPEMRARAVSDRAFLSGIAGRPIDDLVEVFHLVACDVHFWTMNDVLKERTLEHVSI